MKQSTKEQKARAKAVSEAVEYEMTKVHEQLAAGKIAIIETFCGQYQLDSVTRDFWYHTHPEGKNRDSFNMRSWAGCNDGTWANILEQLGIERHPLWRK